MNRKKELVKNTIILAFGTFLPKCAGIITLPIITSALTKAENGTYDLINTFVSLFLPILTLQIHSAAFRFLIDYRGDKKGESKVVTNLLAFILPISVISLLLLFVFLNKYSMSLRIVICLYFFVDMLFIVLQQIVRGFSKNKIYSISTVCTAIVNIALVVVTVEFGAKGLFGVVFSVAVATATGMIIMFIKTKVWEYIDLTLIDKKYIMEMIKYSWPMIPNSLSNWVLSVSDRLVLTFFCGIEVEAVYAMANKIPALYTTIQSTFVLAWQESASLASKDEDTEKYYSEMFDSVFCILCGIMAMMISLTPVMFQILIRGDYSEAFNHMPILFMAMFFLSIASFMGGIYVAHKKTKSVGLSTIVAAGVNLLVNLALVKQIGIFAATISTLVSYCLLAVYRMIAVLKFQQIKYKLIKITIFLLILMVFCILCYINTPVGNIINFILSCIFACVINKNILLIVFKRVLGSRG